VHATFEHFDRNGSGYLDYRELRDALEHYGIDTDTEGARRVVERYDDRPDGKLDIGEFGELVRDIEGGVIRAAKGGRGSAAKDGRGSAVRPSSAGAGLGSSRLSAARAFSTSHHMKQRATPRSMASGENSRWAYSKPLYEGANMEPNEPSVQQFSLPDGARFVDSYEGAEQSPMQAERSQLQYICHELGLASHGTRPQLLERLGYHFDALDDAPRLQQQIQATWRRLISGGSRDFGEVLTSQGASSSLLDRTGPYRRLRETGSLISNRTQRAMLYPDDGVRP